MTSINRQIIEEIDAIARRAQVMALHNLEELEIPPDLSLQNKALYCFQIATVERIRLLSEQNNQEQKWENVNPKNNVTGRSNGESEFSIQDSLG